MSEYKQIVHWILKSFLALFLKGECRTSVRKVLKEPPRPVGLRNEYMTEQKTVLTLYPGGNALSECAYFIEDEGADVLFTVSGRRCSPHCCREVRDQSGLPLFEIHQRSRWVHNEWSITLPGCRTTEIAIGKRRPGGDLHLVLENMAAVGFSVEQRSLPIDLEKYGKILAIYDVVDGDRKIMEIKESIQHNKRLALLSSSKVGYRPAIDMVIMPGVDMALVSLSLSELNRQ